MLIWVLGHFWHPIFGLKMVSQNSLRYVCQMTTYFKASSIKSNFKMLRKNVTDPMKSSLSWLAHQSCDDMFLMSKWNQSKYFDYAIERDYGTDYGICCWYTPQLNYTEIAEDMIRKKIAEPDWGAWFHKIPKVFHFFHEIRCKWITEYLGSQDRDRPWILNAVGHWNIWLLRLHWSFRRFKAGSCPPPGHANHETKGFPHFSWNWESDCCDSYFIIDLWQCNVKVITSIHHASRSTHHHIAAIFQIVAWDKKLLWRRWDISQLLTKVPRIQVRL